MAKRIVKSTGGKEINLRLTLEETNTLIEALGHLPYMRVYRIIEKIHIQAMADDNMLATAPKKKAAKKK